MWLKSRTETEWLLKLCHLDSKGLCSIIWGIEVKQYCDISLVNVANPYTIDFYGDSNQQSHSISSHQTYIRTCTMNSLPLILVCLRVQQTQKLCVYVHDYKFCILTITFFIGTDHQRGGASCYKTSNILTSLTLVCLQVLPAETNTKMLYLLHLYWYWSSKGWSYLL